MDTIIATADALTALERAAIPVRVVVTDLDTDPARVCARTRKRGFVAVHGHGDNRRQLTRWVPRMRSSHTIGTTQASPLPNVYNFGGFTDGDRAAFMADALGAETMEFIGWDLDAPTVSPRKRTKLEIARELLALLEQRRETRFSDLQLSGNASSIA